MQITCYKCGWSWNYTGESKNFICCANKNCRSKLSYKKILTGNTIRTKVNLSDIKREKQSPKIVNKKEIQNYKNIEKRELEIKEIGVINSKTEFHLEGPIKFCSHHNLPAKYDPEKRKWICETCFKETEKSEGSDLEIKIVMDDSKLGRIIEKNETLEIIEI